MNKEITTTLRMNRNESNEKAVQCFSDIKNGMSFEEFQKRYNPFDANAFLKELVDIAKKDFESSARSHGNFQNGHYTVISKYQGILANNKDLSKEQFKDIFDEIKRLCLELETNETAYQKQNSNKSVLYWITGLGAAALLGGFVIYYLGRNNSSSIGQYGMRRGF